MLKKPIFLLLLSICVSTAWAASPYTEAELSSNSTQYNKNTNRFCIAQGTQITMGDESLRNIERIQKGNMVMVYDFDTNTTIAKRVANIHKSAHTRMVRVKLENGNEITATTDTPFLSTEGWKSVSPEQTMADDVYQDVLECAVEENLLFYDIVSVVYYPVKMIQGIATVTTAYAIELEDEGAYIANGFFIGQQ